MSNKKILKQVIIPSVLSTIVTTILGYNFSLKGRPPLSNDELPFFIVFAFVGYLIGFGWKYVRDHL